MALRTLLGLVLAAVNYQVVADQICSLYDGDISNPVTLFDYTSFTDGAVNLTGTTIVNNALRLAVAEEHGGVVGYAWHPTKERIADGFISTFTFRIPVKATQDSGDGFTYFIQNDKTQDLNGGSGDKLGAFGIKRAIAVRVDLCVDRPAPCTQMALGLSITNSTFGSLPISPSIIFVPNLADNNVHTITVTYNGRLNGDANAKLRVGFDTNATLFDVNLGISLEKLFGDRFAFFGFTASTSWTETADIDILSWKTVLVPADSRVKDLQSSTPFRFEFGTLATFKVIRRSSCGADVSDDGSAVVNATLNQIPLTGQDEFDAFKLVGNVTAVDGAYIVSFQLPDQLQATWNLNILVNGVASEGMPFDQGVVTFKPLPSGSGLPIWALILLLLLILLIILVLSYVVYRLHRYRKKLRQNAEFIEAGKKQAELDKLEDGVAYSANKMVGTIDDLKAQLSKNEDELARLRKRGALGEDQNFTIEQLQKQRDALLEEMNRLKREEQEEELKRSKQTETFASGGRAKKEFGREQI